MRMTLWSEEERGWSEGVLFGFVLITKMNPRWSKDNLFLLLPPLSFKTPPLQYTAWYLRAHCSRAYFKTVVNFLTAEIMSHSISVAWLVLITVWQILVPDVGLKTHFNFIMLQIALLFLPTCVPITQIKGWEKWGIGALIQTPQGVVRTQKQKWLWFSLSYCTASLVWY